jgi:ATP-dependent protease HslVU (ClpYQ) peptidase subunit
MSAIMAIERNGVVYLGADSVVTMGDINHPLSYESNVKIRKMPNGIIVAGNASRLINIQHLLLHDEWFELEEGEVFDKAFIATKIATLYYEETKDLGMWNEDERLHIKESSAAFIFAKDSDIYVMFSDLSVVKCDGFAAISNEDADIIMKSYVAKSSEEDPYELIRKTFEFTSNRNCGVFTHGYIIDTKNQEFRKMEA